MSKYKIDEKTQAELDERFTYHRPHGDQAERYVFMRAHFKALAELICQNVPPSRERSLALTKLQEASMWSNAGIACREAEESDE